MPMTMRPPKTTAALLAGALLCCGCSLVDAAAGATNKAAAAAPAQPPLPPGRLRSFVLVNQLDEPLRVVVAYNVTEALSYAPSGFERLSEIKVESQLLSPTEKGTFGLGAAHWGYGARVVGWEVINIFVEAVQGEGGTAAAQSMPPQPGTDPVIVPASFASPFTFVAAAAQAEGEQADPLLMVATLTQLPPAAGAGKGDPEVNLLTLEVIDGDNGETVASSFYPGGEGEAGIGVGGGGGSETKERHPIDPIADAAPAPPQPPTALVDLAPPTATAAVATAPAAAAAAAATGAGGAGGNRRHRLRRRG